MATATRPAPARPVPVPVPVPPESARSPALRRFGPNWYATVMGTAIVATAGTVLPVPAPRAFTAAVWALSLVLLGAVTAVRGAHWIRHRDRAVDGLGDPATAPFHGCAAMAVLAAGTATLTAGTAVIGEPAAAVIAFVLFGAGTAAALAVAVTVPYLVVVRRRTPLRTASPAWLLPVVPPIVASSAGALLVPRLAPGPGREVLLLCLGLFGIGLLATLIILPVILARLLRNGAPPLALTPALFLIVGPLGQSTTAASHMAAAAPYAADAAVLYGVPVLGSALLWLIVAAVATVRAVRRGMPFTLGWWAFTFPVGTCVTGAAGLARLIGSAPLAWSAAGLYVLLTAAWAVTAFHTLRGLFSGALLAEPCAPAGGAVSGAGPLPAPRR